MNMLSTTYPTPPKFISGLLIGRGSVGVEVAAQLDAIVNDHVAIVDVVASPYWKPMKEMRFSEAAPRSIVPVMRFTLTWPLLLHWTRALRDNVVTPLVTVDWRSISSVTGGSLTCSWTCTRITSHRHVTNCQILNERRIRWRSHDVQIDRKSIAPTKTMWPCTYLLIVKLGTSLYVGLSSISAET